MKYLLYMISLLLFLGSCQEEEFVTYKGESDGISGIYFQRMASYTLGSYQQSYVDSLVYSFAGVKMDITEVSLSVPVCVLGNISDRDRAFKVKVDLERSTAIEDVDFRLVREKYFMPAGQAKVYIPVILIRTPKLLAGTIRLVLTLEENEEFKLLLEEYKGTNQWNAVAGKFDAISFKIRFGEIYTAPSYWSFAVDYFGTWTIEKYRTVNEVAGWVPADWANAGMAGYPVQLGRFHYIALQTQAYLQAQADKGTPVREADGTLMQMPGIYAVEY